MRPALHNRADRAVPFDVSTLLRQEAPFAHRLIMQDGADQFAKVSSADQRGIQDIEPARQLHVALYGFARSHHSEQTSDALRLLLINVMVRCSR